MVHVALVVREYDEAIAFYCGKLHFRGGEDTYQPEQDRRWAVIAPPGSTGANLPFSSAQPEKRAIL
jgi:catechol 2,3-dioxygenase-like lactoylglutathione lyase family enzyme